MKTPRYLKAVKAVEAGQHHVEHYQVVDAREREFQPRGAVAGRLGGKAVLPQELAERLGEQLFVFDYQYSHHNSPDCIIRRKAETYLKKL